MEQLKTSLQELTEILCHAHLKIVTAESCTGGLLAGWLTELPGSSRWFERGFVTYSNHAKQELLGVREMLIQFNGAVSIPVAEAMAKGALLHSQADISLAVTGIAGPDGGSAEKPIGTVCFAWAIKDYLVESNMRCFRHASRQQVRQAACLHSIQGAAALLKRINLS